MNLTFTQAVDRYTPINSQGQYGMSARPEYYSGYGPSQENLNDGHLTRIYKGLARDHGDEVANRFADMVEDLPLLTPTQFLVAFREFWHNDCQYTRPKRKKKAGSDVVVESYDEGAFAAGFGGVMTLMSDRRSDDERQATSDYIKNQFLRAIGREVKDAPLDDWRAMAGFDSRGRRY